MGYYYVRDLFGDVGDELRVFSFILHGPEYLHGEQGRDQRALSKNNISSAEGSRPIQVHFSTSQSGLVNP